MSAAADSDPFAALFDPASLAVVGASNDPAKWGNWIALNALRGKGRRAVYLVNRRGGVVGGEPVYPSLAELPTPAEMVVLAVPVASFDAAVDEALAAGATMLVAITAGFGEMGDDGRERQARIVEQARAAGARLLGPNCMGVFDAETELYVASSPAPPGPVGLLSQSGNLAIEMGILLERERLGFSRLVSLGNQADIEAEELLEALVVHDGTRAIVLYLEAIRDGRRLVAAARRAHAAGKPVVLIAAGASAAASRAARSHTGALAGDRQAIDAACRAGGMIRVGSPQQAVEVVQALLGPAVPRGKRLAIVADGGGHGVIAADLAVEAGLAVPLLSAATAERIAAHLPPTASTANPIDLAGGGEQDFFSYARVVRETLASGEVDAVVLTGFFGGYSVKSDELGRREIAVAGLLADACAETGRLLLVQTMHHDAVPADTLRERSIPVFATIDGAIRALAAAGRWSAPLPAMPPLPPAAAPLTADDYWSARMWLDAAGLPVSPARLLPRGAEFEVGADLRPPLVAKALGLNHKSDAGGVILGLADDDALRAALADLTERLDPPGIVVEEMAPVAQGVELIVGARWDRAFGPIVLVGCGGVYAEILRDVAVALAPVDAGTARALLGSLRGAALLSGARGRPPLDIDGATEFIAALSALVAGHPEIAEAEVNPLLVLPDRVVALDARVSLTDGVPTPYAPRLPYPSQWERGRG
ncbi:MAG TPA: acetate--CoA ligase family protein [Thermomicrobiales bacterium]|nr:acetate--CoA ligase family protein [Thermomicrobiales bacterium]